VHPQEWVPTLELEVPAVQMLPGEMLGMQMQQ